MRSNSKSTAKKAFLGLGAALMGLALWAVLGTVGCQSSVPPTTVGAVTPCPTPILYLGFETLSPFAVVTPIATPVTETGYVVDQSVTLNNPTSGVTYTSILSLSNFYVTQGKHSLDMDIVTPASYNQNILQMVPVAPLNWSNVAALTMDLTVDPSVIAGTTYHYFQFAADTSAVHTGPAYNPYGTYFQPISSTIPTLVAGPQSVTFLINFSAGYIQPTDPLTKLTFIYNSNATGSTNGVLNGTGNIYIDNMQLIQKCP